MTPRERLLEVAPLLWGERWQAAMCRALRVNRRSLARYIKGLRPVPPKLLADLEEALQARVVEIEKASTLEAEKGAR